VQDVQVSYQLAPSVPLRTRIANLAITIDFPTCTTYIGTSSHEWIYLFFQIINSLHYYIITLLLSFDTDGSLGAGQNRFYVMNDQGGNTCCGGYLVSRWESALPQWETHLLRWLCCSSFDLKLWFIWLLFHHWLCLQPD
jgi:hypothetical protein